MGYSTLLTSQLDLHFEEAESYERCLHAPSNSERQALERRIRDGTVVKTFQGMYARRDYWNGLRYQDQVCHTIRTLAELHPRWTFSHASAALLYGLEVPREIAEPIHFKVNKACTAQATRGLVRHCVKKLIKDIELGVFATPLEQTVIECAALYPFQLALPIADSALHQGLTTKEHLTAWLNALKGRRGIRVARRVIEMADSRPDNGGESRVRALMIELGLPLPELQAPIPQPERPGHFYYVDFLFTLPNGSRVVVELDGMDKYVDPKMTGGKSIARVMAEERQREALITVYEHIHVARFSYAQAMNPDFLLRRLAQYGVVPLG